MLVWHCHAGTAPHPDVDLSYPSAWRDRGVDVISMNVGFDAMGSECCAATATSYRQQVLERSDVAMLAGTIAVLRNTRSRRHSEKIASRHSVCPYFVSVGDGAEDLGQLGMGMVADDLRTSEVSRPPSKC